jgi:hypothetical protein
MMPSKITNCVDTPIGFTSHIANKKINPSRMPPFSQFNCPYILRVSGVYEFKKGNIIIYGRADCCREPTIR